MDQEISLVVYIVERPFILYPLDGWGNSLKFVYPFLIELFKSVVQNEQNGSCNFIAYSAFGLCQYN